MRKWSKLKLYITGFILSVLLTLAAYLLVSQHIASNHLQLSHQFLSIALISLAVIQLVVQLVFFLHLGEEKKPRWNLLILLTFASIIFIIIVGSIVIIKNLNYNMTPSQMSNHIIKEEGIKK